MAERVTGLLAGRWPGAANLLRRSHRVRWVLADQVLVSGASFLTGILIARALGLTRFGIFSLAWMVVLIAQSVQTALIISPMMSLGPKEPAASARGYYGATFIQQLLLALLLAALPAGLWLLGRFGLAPGAWASVAGPLALCLLAVQIQDYLRRYHFVCGRVARAFASDLVRNGAQLALLWPVLARVPAEQGVETALLLMAACALAGILVFGAQVPALRHDGPGIGALARRHQSLSGWLLGASLLQWLTSHLFVAASGALLGAAAVGALRAAQNLIAVTHLFFQAADNLVPPHAARIYHRDGRPGLARFVRRLMLGGGALTALAGLALAWPAEWWLRLFFGDEYAAYGLLVAGYAVSYVLMALIVPLRYAFVAMEAGRPVFIGYVLASAFTLAACYPLIESWRLGGVMAGIIGVQLIMLLNLGRHARRQMLLP